MKAGPFIYIFFMGCLSILALLVTVAIVVLGLYIFCTSDGPCPSYLTDRWGNSSNASSSNTIENESSEGPSSLDELENFVVAYPHESGPYSYQTDYGDEEGKPDGIEIRIVREFVTKYIEQHNLEKDVEEFIVWKPVDIGKRINAIFDPDVHMVLGAISYKSDRCKSPRICTKEFHLTDSIGILAKANRNDIDGFCSPILSIANIAVITGTIASESSSGSEQFATCDENITYGNPQPYDFRSQAVSTVAVDNTNISNPTVYITDRRILDFYRRNYYEKNKNSESALKIVGIPKESQNYTFLLKTGSEDIRNALDNAVIEMMQSNEWESWKKEFGIDVDIENP